MEENCTLAKGSEISALLHVRRSSFLIQQVPGFPRPNCVSLSPNSVPETLFSFCTRRRKRPKKKKGGGAAGGKALMNFDKKKKNKIKASHAREGGAATALLICKRSLNVSGASAEGIPSHWLPAAAAAAFLPNLPLSFSHPLYMRLVPVGRGGGDALRFAQKACMPDLLRPLINFPYRRAFKASFLTAKPDSDKAAAKGGLCFLRVP